MKILKQHTEKFKNSSNSNLRIRYYLSLIFILSGVLNIYGYSAYYFATPFMLLLCFIGYKIKGNFIIEILIIIFGISLYHFLDNSKFIYPIIGETLILQKDAKVKITKANYLYFYNVTEENKNICKEHNDLNDCKIKIFKKGTKFKFNDVVEGHSGASLIPTYEVITNLGSIYIGSTLYPGHSSQEFIDEKEIKENLELPIISHMGILMIPLAVVAIIIILLTSPLWIFLLTLIKPNALNKFQREPDNVSLSRFIVSKKMKDVKNPKERIKVFYDLSDKELSELNEDINQLLLTKMEDKLKFLDVQHLKEYQLAKKEYYKINPCFKYKFYTSNSLINDLKKYKKIENKSLLNKNINEVILFLDNKFYLKDDTKILSAGEMIEKFKVNCNNN